MKGGETSTPNRHKSTITGAVPWFMAVVYHGVEVSITDIPYRYHEIKIVSTGLLWPGHFCINPGTTEARPSSMSLGMKAYIFPVTALAFIPTVR